MKVGAIVKSISEIMAGEQVTKFGGTVSYSAPTKEQVWAAINAVRAIADLIKEVKQVPSGVIYSQVMQHMDLATYNGIIAVLKSSGLVTEQNFMLTWVEPLRK